LQVQNSSTDIRNKYSLQEYEVQFVRLQREVKRENLTSRSFQSPTS